MLACKVGTGHCIMVAQHTLALHSPNAGSSPPLSGPVSALVTHLMEEDPCTGLYSHHSPKWVQQRKWPLLTHSSPEVAIPTHFVLPWQHCSVESSPLLEKILIFTRIVRGWHWETGIEICMPWCRGCRTAIWELYLCSCTAAGTFLLGGTLLFTEGFNTCFQERLISCESWRKADI